MKPKSFTKSPLKILQIALLLSVLLLSACTGGPGPANQGDELSVPVVNASIGAAGLKLGQAVFTGLVSDYAMGSVVVGDIPFRTDSLTKMDGGIKVGTLADVLAIRLPDNTHYALVISPSPVKTSTGGGRFELYGVVQSIETDLWKVSDTPVQIGEGAEIDPKIQVGDAVKVQGFLSGGALVAREIRWDDDLDSDEDDDDLAGSDDLDDDDDRDANENELYGVVESISASTWKIAGNNFLVAPNTELKGNIKVGSQVKVHYTQASDGSYMAREIELVSQPGDKSPSSDDDDNENEGRQDNSNSGWDNNNTNGNNNHNGDDDDGNSNDSGSDDNDNDDDDDDDDGEDDDDDDDKDDDDDDD